MGAPRYVVRRPAGASWRSQPWPLRVLRGFLGVTFLYAGIQKFADPNFLHSGTPDFIGAQIRSFQQGSPLHWLLEMLGHVPVITGIGIAFIEIAIGLATLLGVAPIVFAAAGFAVNLILFLSATWHVHPYFLGSDSIYAVAWAAYAAGLVEAQRRTRAIRQTGTRRQRAALATEGIGRREFLRGALVGAGTLLLGMGADAVAGTPARAVRRSTTGLPTVPSGTGSSRGTSSPPVGDTAVATLDSIPVGGAVAFSDPATGDPSVVLRLASNEVVAFSRVCTHAGCLVQYDQGTRLLVCPCHGAEFDPARQATPIAGPAPAPLDAIRVAIDRASGKVVVTG